MVHGAGMKWWLQVVAWTQMPCRAWLKFLEQDNSHCWRTMHTHMLPHIFIFIKKHHSPSLGCRSYENHSLVPSASFSGHEVVGGGVGSRLKF